MTVTTTEARNAGLAELAELLRSQQARKIDFVASAGRMRFVDGVLYIEGTPVQLDDDGVTETEGAYRPTKIFDEGLAEKLKVPLPFLRKMREERVGLYDAITNGLLSGFIYPTDRDLAFPVGDADDRKFLLRCFRADDAHEGVARAMLSDSFKTMDNFDVLTACLQGVKDAGVDVQIDSCDLTDRRMVVRVQATEVKELAPILLRRYTSPFTGDRGIENPVVFAGFELSNSEVGNGAFSLCPRVVIEVCKNGAKFTADAIRAVHLGEKLDEGVIDWSEETVQKTIELIMSKTKDAVATFLRPEYLKAKIAELEKTSETEVDAQTVVQVVGKKLAFTEETIRGVFDHFIRGGDITAGGVMQAVTSYAQVVPDADLAFDLENQAVEAMSLAARG